MAWILGSTTLPTPQGFKREPILIMSEVNTLSGKTKRDYVRTKYRYTLTFEKLTQAEVTTILNEFTQAVKSFSVSETNLTVAAVDVLVEITDREYNTAGGDFREDFKVILIEV